MEPLQTFEISAFEAGYTQHAEAAARFLAGYTLAAALQTDREPSSIDACVTRGSEH
jgi:hypothetical protein